MSVIGQFISEHLIARTVFVAALFFLSTASLSCWLLEWTTSDTFIRVAVVRFYGMEDFCFLYILNGRQNFESFLGLRYSGNIFKWYLNTFPGLWKIAYSKIPNSDWELLSVKILPNICHAVTYWLFFRIIYISIWFFLPLILNLPLLNPDENGIIWKFHCSILLCLFNF